MLFNLNVIQKAGSKLDQSIEKLTHIGWYLDTCLFKDFIERNIRVGFDTAETHDGQTILHVSEVGKRHRRIFVPVIAQGKRFAFELTMAVDELRTIQFSNGTSYYYSELTKAEVFRALRKAHPKRAKSEILSWWEAFAFLMGDYRKVELDFHIGEEFSGLALNFPIRKNVQDYLHLIVAKEKGLAFVTSDKFDGQIDDLKESFYPHIYFWPDVRGEVPI